MRIQRADISVIICAYTLDRWDDLVAAVQSVRRQTQPAMQVILVSDHNDELLARAGEQWPELSSIANSESAGLSGARNSGLAIATSDIVAFLDDDAVAEDTWLQELGAAYVDDDVLGAGGFIGPKWDSRRPGWFPEEFDWVVGCTYRGMAEGAAVRNLIGANMSFRRDVLTGVDGFSPDLGRSSTTTSGLGAEETAACIRAAHRFPQGRFVYAPAARVEHRVPADRATWRYFRQRCYGEGLSKARLARFVGSRDGLSSERHHALVTLPAGMAGAVGSFFRGDGAGLARAAALAGGLMYTGTGYIVGRLTQRAPAAAPQPLTSFVATSPDAAAESARRLRVLMVTPRYFPLVGGVEHHVAQVARLMSAEADVTVLTTDATGELPEFEDVEGIAVRRVRAWPKGRDYYVAPSMYREVARGDWDIVHLQSVHTAVPFIAMLAARRAKIPYVLTFHGGGHSSRVRESLRGIQWTLLRPLLASADRLIAVAEFEAERFSAILGLGRERFVVIPNGSDLSQIEVEAERRRAGGRHTIISVGRLERYKGHQRVIEAMPAVLAEMPGSALRVIGSGPFQPELEQLVDRLGLADKVTIQSIPATDRRAMAQALVWGSLIVLMSEFETHPLAVIEALELGRPALVADTSGLSEIARLGSAHAIPLESTPEQIAEAILQELRNPRTVHSSPAPTWQECTDRLLALYRDVLASHSGTPSADNRARES